MAYPTLSKLDSNQVLQLVVDEPAAALRISGSITAAPGSGIVDVDIDHTTDSIAIGTSGTLFTGTASGASYGLDVNVLNPITGIALTGTVSGVFQPTGLQNGLSTTALIATSAVQALPVIAGQNGFSVRVWAPASAVVYFGASGLSPAIGYPKRVYEEIILDARDNPNVYMYYCTEGAATADIRLINLA